MKSPLISVLIVTWNRREDVLETIRSVYEQTYENIEIVVVDNGSVDGTIIALRQAYPAVRIVELDQNIGISAGRNAGIVTAKGDIILCLDSDASPAVDTLTNIVRKFQSKPEIGVINSKIVDADTMKIGKAGWIYSENDKVDQDSEFLSYSFSEGGAAIRRDVFDKVGLFWERLFFGSEGMDFSLRVLDAGYKILYYPAALFYHRTSHQSRIRGGERERLVFINTLNIYLVRFPWWMFLIFTPAKIGATFFRSFRRGYSKQIFLGLKIFLTQVPSVLKERKSINNKTALNYLKLQSEHGSLSWSLSSWLKHKT